MYKLEIVEGEDKSINLKIDGDKIELCKGLIHLMIKNETFSTILLTAAEGYKINDPSKKLEGDGWLGFSDNNLLFNEEAKKNCRLLFADGSECDFNEEHPKQVMTHFKLAETN